MKILGIDTTRKIAKIIICDTENSLENILSLDENVKHSEGIFLYLEKVLFESNLKLNDFDCLFCVTGPGSFTGIRVGMSVIKGFNKVINKRIIPVNSFEILAGRVKNGLICLNSTSTACYYARIKNKVIEATGVIEKNIIAEFADNQTVYILKEEQNNINIEYNNIVVLEDDVWKDILSVVADKINSDCEESFEPYYLQLSQAERNLKNE